jgi:hypothetical protein
MRYTWRHLWKGLQNANAKFVAAKLQRQLMLLQDICKGTDVKTVHDVISVFRRDTSGTTSVLLGKVAKLMKLFMVLPSSSCSAERSFSTLWRLKTYLRSTMTAERLNSVTVLHIHKELTADLNIDDLMTEFVSANDTRRAMLIWVIGMRCIIIYPVCIVTTLF